MGHRAPGPRPTARTRKREQIRSRVERVALDLFRNQGFEHVTVERIAAEAGVGATTFYRYFGTKDGVLFGYQSRWLQDLRDAVDQLDVGRSRAEQMRDLLSVVVRNFTTELETMQIRDEIVARNPRLLPFTLAVQRSWERELALSLARRRALDPADLTAHADAAVVQLLIRLAFRSWRAGASTNLTDGVEVALRNVASLTTPGPEVTLRGSSRTTASSAPPRATR
jgi:TetR/AcrR family transcriptional regulator, regulator of mycofactocin system